MSTSIIAYDISAERSLVVQEALSWLGTPFQHQQCTKGAGVDCLMLLVGVYGTLLPIPPLPPYAPDEHLHRTGERYAVGLLEFFDSLGVVPALPGDIVSFRFGRRDVSHCGIAVDSAGGFVSANMENGCVEYSRLTGRYWADRWSGTWRLKRWAV